MIKSVKVEYGEIPPREFLDDISRTTKIDSIYNEDFLSELNAKDFVFVFDGRQRFPFDILMLSCDSGANLKVAAMEDFFQELRSSGGLFLVREQVLTSLSKYGMVPLILYSISKIVLEPILQSLGLTFSTIEWKPLESPSPSLGQYVES